jgi:hypothetical protein
VYLQFATAAEAQAALALDGALASPPASSAAAVPRLFLTDAALPRANPASQHILLRCVHCFALHCTTELPRPVPCI